MKIPDPIFWSSSSDSRTDFCFFRTGFMNADVALRFGLLLLNYNWRIQYLRALWPYKFRKVVSVAEQANYSHRLLLTFLPVTSSSSELSLSDSARLQLTLCLGDPFSITRTWEFLSNEGLIFLFSFPEFSVKTFACSPGEVLFLTSAVSPWAGDDWAVFFDGIFLKKSSRVAMLFEYSVPNGDR